VLEVVRFGEARRLITRGGSVAQRTISLEGTNVTSVEGSAPPSYQPAEITLTTSAYSAGLGALLALIAGGSPNARDYPPLQFVAPTDALSRSWQGIWDIDGFFGGFGGPEACIPPMLKWRSAGKGRVLRMYHSEDISPASQKDLIARLIAMPIQREQRTIGFVDEALSSDKRLLWVLFANSMLTTKSPPDGGSKHPLWPPLGSQDAHHMVPTLAFGHAWSLA
jgi:hypothetical protein